MVFMAAVGVNQQGGKYKYDQVYFYWRVGGCCCLLLAVFESKELLVDG